MVSIPTRMASTPAAGPSPVICGAGTCKDVVVGGTHETTGTVAAPIMEHGPTESGYRRKSRRSRERESTMMCAKL